ncbi:MAG: prepilin peptidase [Paenibacillaceae bacterium]|nr:prepilin peptidase [Paenibacillaceae bacterium]
MAVYTPGILLSLLLIAAFVTDVGSMRIPNRLTVCFSLAGILSHVLFEGWQGMRFSMSGLATGFGLLMLLHIFGATGAGDVKLFAAIGTLAGPVFTLHCLLYSVVYAGAIGLAMALFRREWMRQVAQFFCRVATIRCLNQNGQLLRLKNYAVLRFPFMYAVLPGAISAWAGRSLG